METKKKKRVRESLGSQISRLANFIIMNVPGEPSRSEGAVDTAIRVMKAGLVETVKVGDVVRLKSGGAEMTVLGHVLPTGFVKLAWMGGYEKQVFVSRLPISSLVVVEKKKDSIVVSRGFETKER
jgi:uncharacterized protein YodC (DUF2158 family)